MLPFDSFQTEWKLELTKEIRQMGFSTNVLLAMGHVGAKAALKQRIWDIELQEHMSQSGKYSVVTNNAFTISSNLTSTRTTKTRRAFTLVRLNVLPSKLMEGRFQHTPISDCLCPCHDGQVETVGHVLLYCLFYRDLCTNLLSPIILRYPGSPDEFYIKLLLSDRLYHSASSK